MFGCEWNYFVNHYDQFHSILYIVGILLLFHTDHLVHKIRKVTEQVDLPYRKRKKFSASLNLSTTKEKKAKQNKTKSNYERGKSINKQASSLDVTKDCWHFTNQLFFFREYWLTWKWNIFMKHTGFNRSFARKDCQGPGYNYRTEQPTKRSTILQGKSSQMAKDPYFSPRRSQATSQLIDRTKLRLSLSHHNGTLMLLITEYSGVLSFPDF